MNRQQRRKNERETEKKINKKLNVLKKDNDPKNKEVIDVVEWSINLTRQQQEYIAKLMNEASKNDLAVYEESSFMVLTSNFGIEKANEIMQQICEEGLKCQEYVKKGESYMAKIKENEKVIIEAYNNRGDKKESELIKDLAFKYNLTNNAVKSVIKKYKAEQEEKKIIEKAVEYIFEEEKDTTNEKVDNKPIESEKKPKYKIIKEVIQRDIEGDRGVYHIENGVMKIEDTVYTKVEDIKQDYSDTMKDIELEYQEKIKELEELKKERIQIAISSKDEAIEIMELYM